MAHYTKEMVDKLIEELTKKHVRQISRARAPSGYFTYYRAYEKFMTMTESWFLHDLINRKHMCYVKSMELIRYNKRPLIDDEDYFQCTTAYLMNPLYTVWSKKTQRRILGMLIKRNLVKTKKKGLPGKRWLWVNFPLIEDALDQLEIEKAQKLGVYSSSARKGTTE